MAFKQPAVIQNPRYKGRSIMNPRKTYGHRSTSQAFTRADLVASIAVAVMLAALGASAISSSKDNVNRAVCGRNMRQMALAEGMYAADNRDYMAFCNWDGASGTDPSPGYLYTLPIPKGLPGAGSDTCPNPFASPYAPPGGSKVPAASAWYSGVWFPYTLKPEYYLCPTDIQSKSWQAGAAGRNNKLSSYVMNGAACNFGQTGGFGPMVFKVSDVWSPDCYLEWEVNENAIGFENPGAFEFNDGANYPSLGGVLGDMGSLHGNNGGEVVTVGGSVRFITISNYFSQVKNKGPNIVLGKTLVWWAPNVTSGGFTP